MQTLSGKVFKCIDNQSSVLSMRLIGLSLIPYTNAKIFSFDGIYIQSADYQSVVKRVCLYFVELKGDLPYPYASIERFIPSDNSSKFAIYIDYTEVDHIYTLQSFINEFDSNEKYHLIDDVVCDLQREPCNFLPIDANSIQFNVNTQKFSIFRPKFHITSVSLAFSDVVDLIVQISSATAYSARQTLYQPKQSGDFIRKSPQRYKLNDANSSVDTAGILSKYLLDSNPPKSHHTNSAPGEIATVEPVVPLMDGGACDSDADPRHVSFNLPIESRASIARHSHNITHQNSLQPKAGPSSPSSLLYYNENSPNSASPNMNILRIMSPSAANLGQFAAAFATSPLAGAIVDSFPCPSFELTLPPSGDIFPPPPSHTPHTSAIRGDKSMPCMIAANSLSSSNSSSLSSSSDSSPASDATNEKREKHQRLRQLRANLLAQLIMSQNDHADPHAEANLSLSPSTHEHVTPHHISTPFTTATSHPPPRLHRAASPPSPYLLAKQVPTEPWLGPNPVRATPMELRVDISEVVVGAVRSIGEESVASRLEEKGRREGIWMGVGLMTSKVHALGNIRKKD